jgi:hypothetical protein
MSRTEGGTVVRLASHDQEFGDAKAPNLPGQERMSIYLEIPFSLFTSDTQNEKRV